jgi:hypothetical protein
MSYANAFLQPVEGGKNKNLMTESAKALERYVYAVGKAFAPPDMRRLLMAVGPAAVDIQCDKRIDNVNDLTEAVASFIMAHGKSAA